MKLESVQSERTTSLVNALTAKNWSSVSAQAQALIAASPDAHLAHWAIGLYYANGCLPPRWADAILAVTKAVKLAPSHVEYGVLLARLLLASGMAQEAWQHTQNLASLHPNNLAVLTVQLECAAGCQLADQASQTANAPSPSSA